MNIESGMFFINDEDKTEEVLDCYQIVEVVMKNSKYFGEANILGIQYSAAYTSVLSEDNKTIS